MAIAARNPVAFFITALTVAGGFLAGAFWRVGTGDPWGPAYVLAGLAVFVGIVWKFAQIVVDYPAHIMGDSNVALKSGNSYGTKENPKEAREVDRDPSKEPDRK